MMNLDFNWDHIVQRTREMLQEPDGWIFPTLVGGLLLILVVGLFCQFVFPTIRYRWEVRRDRKRYPPAPMYSYDWRNTASIKEDSPLDPPVDNPVEESVEETLPPPREEEKEEGSSPRSPRNYGPGRMPKTPSSSFTPRAKFKLTSEATSATSPRNSKRTSSGKIHDKG